MCWGQATIYLMVNYAAGVQGETTENCVVINANACGAIVCLDRVVRLPAESLKSWIII